GIEAFGAQVLHEHGAQLMVVVDDQEFRLGRRGADGVWHVHAPHDTCWARGRRRRGAGARAFLTFLYAGGRGAGRGRGRRRRRRGVDREAGDPGTMGRKDDIVPGPPAPWPTSREGRLAHRLVGTRSRGRPLDRTNRATAWRAEL